MYNPVKKINLKKGSQQISDIIINLNFNFHHKEIIIVRFDYFRMITNFGGLIIIILFIFGFTSPYLAVNFLYNLSKIIQDRY